MRAGTLGNERSAWAQLQIVLSRAGRSLAYTQQGKRDLRLDFLRGLAVSAMIVDHVGGDTVLTALSGGNKAIVSAAEAFVFLAGLVLGIVYGGRIRRAGTEQALWGLVRRAFVLYRVSLGMALAFLALFFFTDLRLWGYRPGLLGVGDPIQAVVGAITLHYSFHGSDVMVMYTLMLSAAPLIFFLMHRGRTREVLIGSALLWAIYQRYPAEASFPWPVQNSAFPVAAWQLMLVLGLVVGFHRARVQEWLLSGSLSSRLAVLGSAVGTYLLFRSEALYGSQSLPVAIFGDATYASLFDKAGLAPGRVLAFLGIAILAFTVVSALWVPLKATLGWFALPLGQNSLYVYVSHLFVIVFIYNLVPLVLTRTAGVITVDQLNLGAQLLELGVVWVLVRSQFLVSIVPQHGPNHTAG
jgi:hypothetical protein